MLDDLTTYFSAADRAVAVQVRQFNIETGELLHTFEIETVNARVDVRGSCSWCADWCADWAVLIRGC